MVDMLDTADEDTVRRHIMLSQLERAMGRTERLLASLKPGEDTELEARWQRRLVRQRQNHLALLRPRERELAVF